MFFHGLSEFTATVVLSFTSIDDGVIRRPGEDSSSRFAVVTGEPPRRENRCDHAVARARNATETPIDTAILHRPSNRRGVRAIRLHSRLLSPGFSHRADQDA